MKSPSLRRADPADAEALAELGARTFFETFEEHCAPADMKAYLASSFSVEQVRCELDDASNVFILAFVSDITEPVGYAKIRLGTTEDCIRGVRPLELERLYVDRVALGQGVGKTLMQHCLDDVAARGCDTVWLGVWEHNDRAIRFYERWGFEVVGSHIFRIGTDDQTDLVMERPVLLE